jgi:protease II
MSPEEEGGSGMKAPVALREPVEHVIHGDRRMDHYAWLRDKSAPRVIAYLNEENAYADRVMGETAALQEKLYREMLGRILQTDLSVPYLLRGYSYYTRTEEGKQYAIYCRRRAKSSKSTVESSQLRIGESLEAREQRLRDERAAADEELLRAKLERHSEENPIDTAKMAVPQEEVLLDLNLLAEGKTFLGLGIFEVSDDNELLAFATDTTGYRQYTLEIKSLRTGELLPFRAERVTSAAWAKDNRTIFYVLEDEVSKRSYQVYRHRLGGKEVDSLQLTAERSGVQELKKAEEDFHHRGHGEHREIQQDGGASSGDLVDMGRSASEPRVNGAAPLQKTEDPHRQGYAGDELLYEEKDERFRMDVERTRSGAYLLLVLNSHTTSEVRYLRADEADGKFQLIEPREEEHEYYVDHHPGSGADPAGGIFFIRTNNGGRTYRLMTASTSDLKKESWLEVIPNRPRVMLSACEAFRTHLVLTEREDGLPHLRIVDLMREAPSAMAASWRMDFAEPAYNAGTSANPEFDTGHMRYHYESLVTPRSVYDFDLATGERFLRKQQPVLGGYHQHLYKSERLHATAADGTRIPLSVVYRQDTLRDGKAALLLYGYGSYGLSMPVTFSSNRLSLLDRGFIFVIAHVRGGGELGKPWHDAGRMGKKMNTFTDFIASAEYLLANWYTSKEKLAIQGGSAGGLLMGAVCNLRPELFHAVVSQVPFVDVLNTMLDPTLPLTVGEYEEWGDPRKEQDYFYLKGYCPYTNLDRKEYPAMLVKAGLNDSQVMFWEPAKYVAKMRTVKTDGNTLLLKTNMGAGHGGASGRYDYLKEIAFDYAFLLREMGIAEQRTVTTEDTESTEEEKKKGL